MKTVLKFCERRDNKFTQKYEISAISDIINVIIGLKKQTYSQIRTDENQTKQHNNNKCIDNKKIITPKDRIHLSLYKRSYFYRRYAIKICF